MGAKPQQPDDRRKKAVKSPPRRKRGPRQRPDAELALRKALIDSLEFRRLF